MSALEERVPGLRTTVIVVGMLLVASAVSAGTPPASGGESDVLAVAAQEKPHKVPRVPWLTNVSWAEVRNRAQALDQPILLDFTATWCGPCKLLDVMVFTEKPVIAQLADVVTFQVDIDKPEYQALKDHFGIDAIPTVVWCDRDGQEIDRFTGYVSSVQFLGIVGAWKSNRTIDRVLQERRNASPQDPLVLLDVARRQAERGNDRQADVLYRRLINLRFDADARTVARGMLGLAEIEHRAGHELAARTLGRRVASFYAGVAASPATRDSRTEGILEAALFQEAINDTVGMLTTYRTLAETDHRSVLALHGYARAAVKAGVDLPAATRSALRAVVYSDNDPDVISTLAECYYWRGLYGRAIRWQEKAVAAAPHQQIYNDQLQRYRDAQAADPHHMRGPPQRPE